MLQLPHNCRMGDVFVRPLNWDSPGADASLLWKISYWFYDDNLKKRMRVLIRGMNRLATLKEKQDFVKQTLKSEENFLLNQGWNPITQTYSVKPEPEIKPEVSPTEKIIPALQHAYTKLKTEPSTLACVKSCLVYVNKAIRKLHYHSLAIGDIKRRHIKAILERCGEGREFSASSYNHYRAYLLMLFKELLEMDAVEINPVRDIAKKKQAHRMREQLTKKEREKIREHLTANDPAFWTYVNLFFHSGGREAELLRVRKSDVDLAGQRYKALIKKGRVPREEWCVIKDIVLDEWKRLYTLAQNGTDYLFSRDLLPGPKPIHRDRVTRRWEARVKKELGINKDLYVLKHGNLDEMAEALQKHKESVQEASRAARHSTPVVTLKHYLAGEKEREKLTIQKIQNEF